MLESYTSLYRLTRDHVPSYLPALSSPRQILSFAHNLPDRYIHLLCTRYSTMESDDEGFFLYNNAYLMISIVSDDPAKFHAKTFKISRVLHP